MSPLHVGTSLGGGSLVERVDAIEAAITRIDAALAQITEAVLADGNRTPPALDAAKAVGAPDPPPLPSV